MIFRIFLFQNTVGVSIGAVFIVGYKNVSAYIGLMCTIPLLFLTALLMASLFPYRLEITESHLNIINLLRITVFRVSLDSITSAQLYPIGLPAVGIKISTDFGKRIEIQRKNGLNLYVSPTDPEEFLRQLRIKMDRYG